MPSHESGEPENRWDPGLYQSHHGFVWKYGEDLIDLLAPQPGERVLDIGCGTGQLTARIAAANATVVGVDNSPEMIEQARRNYPNLRFEVADASDLHLPDIFDAVFSNAALHWIRQATRVAQTISRSLKAEGRMVAELGGKGNVQCLLEAASRSLETVDCPLGEDSNPWYFPSVGEYASLLEEQGLAVTFAALFERPTRLDEGDAGLAQWMRMFGGVILGKMPPERQSDFLYDLEDRLRPKLWHDGAWVLDYVRLRIRAVKRA